MFHDGIIQRRDAAPDLRRFVRCYYSVDSQWPGVEQVVPVWTKSLMLLYYSDKVYNAASVSRQKIPMASLHGAITEQYRFTIEDEDIRFFR